MQSRDTVGQARVLHLAYTRRELLALHTIDSLPSPGAIERIQDGGQCIGVVEPIVLFVGTFSE